jgi:hypothetical protein
MRVLDPRLRSGRAGEAIDERPGSETSAFQSLGARARSSGAVGALFGNGATWMICCLSGG